jgi:putative ABC transport system substrate-binding protein
MKRREFIGLVGGVSAAPLLWPRAARSQRTASMPMLGILMPGIERDQDRQLRLAVFRTALARLGWSEGNNLRIEVRWGGEDRALLARYAAELIALSPNVLLCDGSAALEALQRQTQTAPIVFVTVGDPVGQSFVQSLARPGGNITGFSAMDASLAEKWLEMLSQIVPSVKNVAVLYNPATVAQLLTRSLEKAAPHFGFSVRTVPVEDVAGIEAIMADLAREQQSGMVVLPNSFTVSHRAAIIALAARYRVPAVYGFPYFASDGGLMAYGVNVTDLHRRSAVYVDRILKGDKPADLPVQRPIKFDLVINLKTAKALGIDIAPALLVAADEVIE